MLVNTHIPTWEAPGRHLAHPKTKNSGSTFKSRLRGGWETILQCDSPFLPPVTQWATALLVVYVNCLKKKLLLDLIFSMREEIEIAIPQAWHLFQNTNPKGQKERERVSSGDNYPRQSNNYCRHSLRTSALGYYILRCKIYLCLNFLYGKLFRGNDLLLLPDKGNLDSSFPTLIFWELGIETAVFRRAFVQFAHHGLRKGHFMKGLRSHDRGVLGTMIIICAFFIESLI